MKKKIKKKDVLKISFDSARCFTWADVHQMNGKLLWCHEDNHQMLLFCAENGHYYLLAESKTPKEGKK